MKCFQACYMSLLPQVNISEKKSVPGSTITSHFFSLWRSGRHFPKAKANMPCSDWLSILSQGSLIGTHFPYIARLREFPINSIVSRKENANGSEKGSKVLKTSRSLRPLFCGLCMKCISVTQGPKHLKNTLNSLHLPVLKTAF